MRAHLGQNPSIVVSAEKPNPEFGIQIDAMSECDRMVSSVGMTNRRVHDFSEGLVYGEATLPPFLEKVVPRIIDYDAGRTQEAATAVRSITEEHPYWDGSHLLTESELRLAENVMDAIQAPDPVNEARAIREIVLTESMAKLLTRYVAYELSTGLMDDWRTLCDMREQADIAVNDLSQARQNRGGS